MQQDLLIGQTNHNKHKDKHTKTNKASSRISGLLWLYGSSLSPVVLKLSGFFGGHYHSRSSLSCSTDLPEKMPFYIGLFIFGRSFVYLLFIFMCLPCY